MSGTGGGVAGTGGTGGAVTPCYSVAFTTPTNGQTLTVADDKTSTCADGFQYDVVITTGAPTGTDVSLYSGTSLLQTKQVAGGGATFSVQLASTGSTALQVQFPSTSTCTDPSTKSMVTVSCPNTPPTCSVIQPTISGADPALNGVQAPAGDRTSSTGSAYQSTFVVATNAEDGQPVSLQVTNEQTSAVTTVSTTATGGSATLGVTLVPDGTYDVVATCTNKNGIAGSSALAKFPVDTTPPNLVAVSPTDGQFFSPSTLTNGAFQVCGQTDSLDAVALDAALGARVNNFCVALGASTKCTSVLVASTSTCVGIPCPGSAPFNLNITLTDAAGNPTTKTVSGITCASSLPSVQIVSPVSDGPAFADSSKRILSTTAPVGIRDLDGAAAGAQANVVACTDTSGTAALLVGHQAAGALSPLVPTVATTAAVPTDNCPSGLGFAAHFTGVTLPESTEDASGTLTAATEIAVAVTSGTLPITGTSAAVDLWVDSLAPALALSSPAGLCGSFQQATGPVTQAVAFAADDGLVTVQVLDGNNSTDTYSNSTFAGGIATFSAVVFDQGQNDLTAGVDDPAGNRTFLTPDPCSVTIGSAPVVTFTTPAATNFLCPVGATAAGCIADANGSTAGWQGTITVHVTGGSQPVITGNVTFSIGATTLGVAALDGSGNASISATLPEGSDTIVATTDNVPNRGVGTGTVIVVADLTAPNAPTALNAVVTDRRKTTMQVAWTAPADVGGADVTGYQVRYAKVPIDATNFDNASIATPVAYTGTPRHSTLIDGLAVSTLYIENGYYFAVAATDAVGNRSVIAATGSATAAHFLTTVLSGATGDTTGADVNGAGDFGQPAGSSFTGDKLSDLLVGANVGKHVYLFFGTSAGYSTTPSVTFTGAMNGFGSSVADAGDIDGDGLDDIAIASPSDGNGKVFIFSRKNPPASWGTTTSWPANLTDTQANYVISSSVALAGKMYIRILARLGNFDGLGADDLAIGYPLPFAGTGSIFIVKGSSSFSSITIPDATNAIEIDGTAAQQEIGYRMLGIGQFYPSPAGPTLIASAAVGARVFAFKGQSPSAPLTDTASDDSVISSTADRFGFSLGFLGPFGASPGALSIGATTGRYVDVNLGTVAAGPFLGLPGSAPAPTVHFVDSASGNAFGVINFGTGIPGTSQSVSLIGGDSVADLVVAGQTEAGTPIYIVDGKTLGTLSGTVDVSTQTGIGFVKAANLLPSNWAGYTIGTPIPDSNGDTYADFAVGEFSTLAGRVAVFY